MAGLILWHLKSTILENNPINKKVYSYKDDNITETALHKVVHRIEKVMAKK